MNQICKKKENRYSLELLYVKLFQKAKSKSAAGKNTRETDAGNFFVQSKIRKINIKIC